MNKRDLIDQLAKTEGITLEAAELAVNLTFQSMAKALGQEGGRVEIRGLGTIKVKAYEGYAGRNPRTGEPITVEPKRLPVFKMGRELTRRLNGVNEPDEEPQARRPDRRRGAAKLPSPAAQPGAGIVFFSTSSRKA